MAYKIILAIINNDDKKQLSDALVREGLCATRLSSTGGFLRAGNTTLILGVKESQVSKVLSIFEEQCKSRQEYFPELWLAEYGMEPDYPGPLCVNVGGATVFVIDVEQFKKL